MGKLLRMIMGSVAVAELATRIGERSNARHPQQPQESMRAARAAVAYYYGERS